LESVITCLKPVNKYLRDERYERDDDMVEKIVPNIKRLILTKPPNGRNLYSCCFVNTHSFSKGFKKYSVVPFLDYTSSKNINCIAAEITVSTFSNFSEFLRKNELLCVKTIVSGCLDLNCGVI
jgi:hypothetical protein